MQAYSNSRSVSALNPSWHMIALRRFHRLFDLLQESILRRIGAGKSFRIGPILRDYPTPMRRKMLAWSKSSNLWKQRTAIICQLGFKAETDLKLLYACIEPSLGSREFFLQKAIGWALRQYAWIDGDEIKKYVRLNRTRLKALSCREALKNLD